MFGKKERQLKVDDYIFTSRPDGDFTNIIFGTVTGIDGNRIGVNGFITVSYTHLTLPTICSV